MIKYKTYAVRCLFTHPTRVKDGDGNLYEERVLLWESDNREKSLALAHEEALNYAKESAAEFIKVVDSFVLFESTTNLSELEVWSVMRGSMLDHIDYINTFMATPRDRC